MKLITAHRILIGAAIVFFMFFAAFQLKLYLRASGTAPLVVTDAEIDRLIGVTRDAVKVVLGV